MDNIPEREQPRPERIISLDQYFHLFDPKYTNQVEYTDRRVPPRKFQLSRSSILLDVENRVGIPFKIHCSVAQGLKIHSITPFNPEIGYQIDSEDLNISSRLSKVTRYINSNVVDYPEAPFYLEILGRADQAINRLSLNKKEEALALLNRLRVLVAFPKGLYEARIKIGLTARHIESNLFYPADTGPLPTRSDHDRTLYEGFYLYLPPDPEKLSQIRAMFVLAQEQPQQDQI